MKKKDFIDRIFKGHIVLSGDCGQHYHIEDQREVWVDCIGKGQVSIKAKYFRTFQEARDCAGRMYSNLINYVPGSVVDAATRADAYLSYSGGYRAGWAARLICDKHW